jgi:hypothetical protein
MISIKKTVASILFLILTFFSFCEELHITANDIRLEPNETSGYNLFIRATTIKSILLTETTKDPEGKADNYSYRATEWNKYNGDEIRILDGKTLTSKYSNYSLIDSTPESDTQFGKAFQIYIPETLIWGFPWARNGTTQIDMGTFINIRAFEKPYADYSGKYFDNPFMFDFQAPPKKASIPITTPVLTDIYRPEAAKAFSQISTGMLIYSHGPETIVNDILKSFNEITPKDTIDIVFAIDATGSMWDDIGELQQKLIPELTKALLNCGNVRLGLLWYRDYGDNFSLDGLPVRMNKFTTDTNLFFTKLKEMKISQGSIIGGDIPEAVYEALYASIVYYPWSNLAQRKIILIGDAEPHPNPRGIKQISEEYVNTLAKKRGITIDCIILPEK